MERVKKLSPWWWIPTLYFAQGLPYVAVMTISVIMYKRMGESNTDIALYTGWLYLPWVIKPFWSPFVDIMKTKRWWTVTMQWVLAVALCMLGFAIPGPFYFQVTLAIFWIIGFTSATHDVAADGFYMLGLTEHEQSLFVGIRSTFYRIATVAGQGLLVILAGLIETGGLVEASDEEIRSRIPMAWMTVFIVLSVFFLLVAIYHSRVLPRPQSDGLRNEGQSAGVILREFIGSFKSFFQKEHIVVSILFMLLYRLPEAQLVKLINPFLLDPVEKGGMGLSTGEVGLVYGTVGIIGLTIGGIIGGMVAARDGLKKWLMPMAWSMSLTCLTFVYLSYFQPQSLWLVSACVFLEQFGYGFGFTAYMLYLIYFSRGNHQTSHYAICTGFMALGMMLPGMAAGWLQETIGYQHFFVWTIICCIATIGVCSMVKIDPKFGKK